MKLFVFAIGGTGARVMRALTFLLASGAKVPENLTIIPILLDMDMQNGDTSRAIETIEMYRAIRTTAYPNNQAPTPDSFFAAALQPIGTLEKTDKQERMNGQERIGDSFLPQLTENQGTFGEFLKVKTLDEIDRRLLNVLYDNSKEETTAELKLNLSVGFKGNPNVGSVVFNAIEDSVLFKHFTGAFNNETDRIFIVSSIFGGTGSSGFPHLIKLFQESNQKAPIRNAKKGALTVMPYFALKDNPQSAIDQERFYSKTKAALSYYQGQFDLDSLYYIGDKAGSKLYANVEGGKDQANNAHIIELLGAEAILDFANRRQGDFNSSKAYFEYGLKRNDRILTFTHFSDPTFTNVMQPMIRLAYASKFLTDYVPRHLNEAFAKNLGIPNKQLDITYCTALSQFLGPVFRTWLSEMADNDRTFDPFNFELDFNGLIRLKQIETRIIFGLGQRGISDQFLLDVAGDIEHKLTIPFPIAETRLMHLLMAIATKCMEKLGPLNRQLV